MGRLLWLPMVMVMAYEMSSTRFETFISTSVKFFNWEDIMTEAGITQYSDKGDQYEITCPFHEDKRPSCRLTKSTGQYHCFSCERRGTYTRFLWELNGKTVPYGQFCEQVLKARPDIQQACGFNSLFISEKTLDPAFEKRRVFVPATSLGTGMSITTLHDKVVKMGDTWENLVASMTLLQQGVKPEGIVTTLKKQHIEVKEPARKVGLLDLLDT